MNYRILGGRALTGEVTVPGAKNALLHLLAAALLTDEPVVLRDVPDLRDVRTQLALLEALGKRVEPLGEGAYRIAPGRALAAEAPSELVRQLRASFHVLGPLLARLGEAYVPLPGGDVLGPRPVDLHLQGLKALGADIEVVEGGVWARARRLRPAAVALPYPSVGATIHLALTAALVPGTTVIENPAREPEVDEVLAFLSARGAPARRTRGYIEVRGQPELHGAEHRVMPDRICAGTYLLAGVITQGELEVRCRPWHLRPFLDTLQAMGVKLRESSDGVAVRCGDRRALRPVRITTRPYPGFPTDLHPPLAALLSLVPGESRIREEVFQDRFAYAPGLSALGARVRIRGREAIIEGVPQLRGAEVRVERDNRAGAALVLAALAAEGESLVRDEEEQIPRGYSRFTETLRSLGADITEKSLIATQPREEGE